VSIDSKPLTVLTALQTRPYVDIDISTPPSRQLKSNRQAPPVRPAGEKSAGCMKHNLEIITQIIGRRASKYASLTELSRANSDEIQAIQGVSHAVFSVTIPRGMTRENKFGSHHAADMKPA